MSDKKRSGGRLAAILTLIFILASSVALLIIFGMTKYLPYCLAGIILLLPTAINIIILLFGAEANKNRDGKPSQTAPDGAWEVAAKGKKVKAAVGRLKRGAIGVAKAIVNWFLRTRIVLSASLVLLTVGGLHLLFWLFFKRMTSIYRITFVSPVIFTVLFVLFIVADKWCKHIAADNEEDKYIHAVLGNIRCALAVGKLVFVLTATAQTVRLLGFYELQRWLVIALAVIFCYETLFILLSFTVRLIKRELTVEPYVPIPIPFLSSGIRGGGILTYLENNTGITMRSLWSMKFIKTLVPYTIIFGVAILWLCSGIVVVESYQTGVVYRFGQIVESSLTPGIHIRLPYPIEKTDIYDTETVKRITVGYISNDNTDNTWTGTHGSNEYRLLLGGGDEVVSVNLRIEYNIEELDKYLRCCSKPELLLSAKAYEMITDRMINTDIETLLSVDRNEFSESFRTELSEELDKTNTGLCVIGVILESIHPPVEVASVYQEIISAEIDAEKKKINAQATAIVTVEKALTERNTLISNANAEYSTKTAEANADVAEFMASVSADNAYPTSYRYYKYMEALKKAYGNAKLLIVGDGIDSSNIWLGNATVASEGKN